MKLLMLVIAACVAMAASAYALQDKPLLKVGDAAPDFKLKGSDGKDYTLAQFKGKQGVVIAWFPKAFTGGWTAECNSLRDSGEEIRKFDVAYFTASCDPYEGDKGNKAFAESLKLDYPILSDPDRKVAEAYGVVHGDRKVPERWTFYMDKEGKIKFIDQKVNTKDHGKDVAQKLEELGFPKKK